MIQFIECQKEGYPARTEENVKNSEATIAIAVDFESAGEKLTKKLCNKYQKLYIPVHYGLVGNIDMARTVAGLLKQWEITSINGAGNGIYHLPGDQMDVNIKVGIFFTLVCAFLEKRIIKSVRSGGQTGIDTGFLFAAEGQYVPEIICLAPKGWMFRGKDRKDIKDEKLFKERFL